MSFNVWGCIPQHLLMLSPWQLFGLLLFGFAIWKWRKIHAIPEAWPCSFCMLASILGLQYRFMVLSWEWWGEEWKHRRKTPERGIRGCHGMCSPFFWNTSLCKARTHGACQRFATRTLGICTGHWNTHASTRFHQLWMIQMDLLCKVHSWYEFVHMFFLVASLTDSKCFNPPKL